MNKPDEAIYPSHVPAHAKTPIEFLLLEFGTVPFHLIYAAIYIQKE